MIFIAWHLGLGDAIACAAIVAKLAQTEDQVVVPCWLHNKVSVKSLFVNHPNVMVRNENDREALKGECKTLRLGHYNAYMPQLPGEDFVQWFYRQAGMDISEKQKYCPVFEAAIPFFKKSRDTGVWYGNALVHDDNRRGFNIPIDDKICYRPYYDPSERVYSILEHTQAIIESKEIHCIDSSFLHLAEALNVPGKKFYHKYARPESTDYNYLKNWDVLN